MEQKRYDRQAFADLAAACRVPLHEQLLHPACPETPLDNGDSITLDLGNYYVGHLSFHLWHADRYLDAPVRLRIKFCETAWELEQDFSVSAAWICRSWLQEEVIHVDRPGQFALPRRYACRYIRITVEATPQKLLLRDCCFRAVSSADTTALRPLHTADAQLRQLDSIAVNTLKNCMQGVFEDGPKRDRRLWSGDLRLQALTNYYTFDNRELVKKCLFLFAACRTSAQGLVPSDVFEYVLDGDSNHVDYALFYVVTVCEYFTHTGDAETVEKLLPVCDNQLAGTAELIDGEGCPSCFVDWCEGLQKWLSLAGIYLYALEKYAAVLAHFDPPRAAVLNTELATRRRTLQDTCFDPGKGLFLCDRDGRQISVHSQVWMILGGVAAGEQARRVLETVSHTAGALQPFTPYMHHYIAEAIAKTGDTAGALAYVRKIWGGMADADTFREVYVPGDPDFSAVWDRKLNSACHAWSSTPAYFIRRYAQP